MAKELTKDQVEDYLMSKSIMDAKRTWPQWVTDILFGRTVEDKFTNTFSNPLGGLAPLRVMTYPELNSLVKHSVQEGLGAKWFRGHSGSRPIENVIREGFLPRASLQKYGEPLGVSLTSSPSVAGRFTANDAPIMRVAVLSKPHEVLDIGGFTIPNADVDLAHELFRLANRETFQQFRGGELLSHAKTLKERTWPNPVSRALQNLPEGEKTQYNKLLSDILRDRGYNAIAYSPDRYGELELRVLDPKKAIPVGTLKQGGKEYSEVRIRPYHNRLARDIVELYRKRYPDKFKPSGKGLEGDKAYTVPLDANNLLDDILNYGKYLAEEHTDRLRRIYPAEFTSEASVEDHLSAVLNTELPDIIRGRNTNKEILERFQDRYSILRSDTFPGGTSDVHLSDILKRESPDWYMGREAPTYRRNPSPTTDIRLTKEELNNLAIAGGTTPDTLKGLLNISIEESPPEDLVKKAVDNILKVQH